MSDLAVSDVRAAIADFFADGAALSEVRSYADGRGPAFDRSRWNALSSELGVGALLVPESESGLGLDARYACAVIECAGAALCPAPVTSTLTAVFAMVTAAGSDTGSWRRAIAEDAAIAAVVVDPEGKGTVTARIDRQSDQHVVAADLVVCDGDSADFLILPAMDSGAVRVVGVDLRSHPADSEVLPSTDFGHSYARVHLRDHPTVDLGDAELWKQIEDGALAFAAAERLGCARGALRMSIDYAGQREQFGRIIGTYQAISHRLAETAVDLEGAAGLVDLAAVAMADRSDRVTALAPLAAAATSRVALRAADTLIQVHGGIGFTWEHDAQFYFRRARGAAQWMGSAGLLEDRAAERNCHRLLTV